MRQRGLTAVIVVLALAVVGLLVWNTRLTRQRADSGRPQLDRAEEGSVARPVEEFAPDTEEQPASSVGTQSVYITRTGKCYHLGSCSSLSRSKIPISLADAKDRGCRPCRRCNPPE